MRHIHSICLCLAAASLTLGCCGNKGQQSIDDRVENTLSQLTLQEKIKLIHAQSKFSSPGVPRLGIPEFWTDDGPHGVRPDVLWDMWKQAGNTNDSCTAYPALTALAASFDPDNARLYGESLGEEARYRGKDMILGPGLNIHRTPFGGRNFEYPGEDPYLTSRIAVPYIQGLQSKGVAACVKHFALNDQELNRHRTNVIVSDRALYEIYLPAFKAAVTEGGTLGVMGSYNLYQDFHGCHNPRLLNDILKGEWGFTGVVVSDWGGTHDTMEAIKNGLDMEFGTGTNGLDEGLKNAYDAYYMAKPYLDLIEKGDVGTEELDDKVRRALMVNFLTASNPAPGYGRFTCPDHYAAARKIGAEGIVLLKNDGNVLPVKGNARKILVVGENAIKMMTVGGGSSSLKVQHEISPLQGIEERFKDAEVIYERGYVGEITGMFDGVTTGQDLSESRSQEQLIADAVSAARDADYVIFVGGLNKSPHQDDESYDRETYSLPYQQDSVISALADANPNLIYVNISGNPVAMPWIGKVPAVVQAWYLGSEAGHALADVLSGDVNPSGKLPFSMPFAYADGPIRTVEQYPGIPRPYRYRPASSRPEYDETYSEGVLVGYRWYDSRGIDVLFPFGYGLSYTSFEIGKPSLSKAVLKGAGSYPAAAHEDKSARLRVRVPVTNAGGVAGAEVVQLYVGDDECSVERPVKELKGFKKVYLNPGETKTAEFELSAEDLAFFEEEHHCWKAEAGTFTLHIGSSSRDIAQKVSFTLK